MLCIVLVCHTKSQENILKFVGVTLNIILKLTQNEYFGKALYYGVNSLGTQSTWAITGSYYLQWSLCTSKTMCSHNS